MRGRSPRKLATRGTPARPSSGGAVVKDTLDGAYISKGARESRRKVELAVAAVMAFDNLGGSPEPLIAWR